MARRLSGPARARSTIRPAHHPPGTAACIVSLCKRCAGPVRIDCVVDGDTFGYEGEKIRIADIDTPETSRPECAAECKFGARATRRLTALLNAGPFTLEPIDRDTDKYSHLLRVVTRGGQSVARRWWNRVWLSGRVLRGCVEGERYCRARAMK